MAQYPSCSLTWQLWILSGAGCRCGAGRGCSRCRSGRDERYRAVPHGCPANWAPSAGWLRLILAGTAVARGLCKAEFLFTSLHCLTTLRTQKREKTSKLCLQISGKRPQWNSALWVDISSLLLSCPLTPLEHCSPSCFASMSLPPFFDVVTSSRADVTAHSLLASSWNAPCCTLLWCQGHSRRGSACPDLAVPSHGACSVQLNASENLAVQLFFFCASKDFQRLKLGQICLPFRGTGWSPSVITGALGAEVGKAFLWNSGTCEWAERYLFFGTFFWKKHLQLFSSWKFLPAKSNGV